MIAPVMTPLLMKLLAHKLVEVNFLTMMLDIIKIVLVPIGAALLHDYLKRATRRGRFIVWGICYLGALWLMVIALGGWTFARIEISRKLASVMSIGGFLFAAVIVGTVYHWLTGRVNWLERKTPVLSMAGIVYFTAVTTAAGRDNLLKVGPLLFVASVLHNGAGYTFGYWLSRLCRLEKNSARSIAFEVGLQNGGMASGIAGSLGKLGTMGLAAAIFSPWMNVSGSVLANYWKQRPTNKENSSFKLQTSESIGPKA
jgi:BASS family bile acid:Na+ symporter